jgi:hypothetical protein
MMHCCLRSIRGNSENRNHLAISLPGEMKQPTQKRREAALWNTRGVQYPPGQNAPAVTWNKVPDSEESRSVLPGFCRDMIAAHSSVTARDASRNAQNQPYVIS